MPFNYKNTVLWIKLLGILTPKLMGIKITSTNTNIITENCPAIVVGPHQHDFDLLMASQVLHKKVVSLGKKQILFIPIFGLSFWLGGNLLINRTNKEKAKKTMQDLNEYIHKKKISINIFPEGTRNAGKELLPFKKGAFYTAIATQTPIIIFGVNRYAHELDLNKWHSCDIRINVLEPIPTTGLTNDDIPALMVTVREKLENEIRALSEVS